MRFNLFFIVLAILTSFSGKLSAQSKEQNKQLELSIFSNFSDPSEQGALLLYKLPLKKSHLRLGLYGQREYQPAHILIQVSEISRYFQQDSGLKVGVGMRIGLEKQKKITDKFDFFYAFDFAGGFSRSNTVRRIYEGSSVVVPVDEIDQDVRAFQVGLIPHAGLRWWLGKSIGLHLQVHSKLIFGISQDVNIPEPNLAYTIDQYPLYVQGGTAWRF